MTSNLHAFADKANLIWGALLAAVTPLLGVWPIFVFFLALNILDFYYGRKKAKKTNTLSSARGAEGICKKISYWVIIALAFAASYILILLGQQIGVNLDFLMLIGWFTLAVYIVNEMTSIVENMLVLGYEVPAIFIKGLAVVKSMVDDAGDKVVPDVKEENTDEP